MRDFAFASVRRRSVSIISMVSALCAIVLWMTVPARATFSIVAVDTASGDVGSAGASCITGASIIERVVEGIGAMNTQAYWNSANQARGDSMMRAGDSPDSIISFLVHNDAQNDGLDQSDRQYGAVTLAGPGASASHTGSNNSYWAGARNGFAYSIQGNILLDSTIVYGMEAAFLATSGPLEDRLMAALEAAKVPGADIRCLGDGKSAISSFIQVVRPGDGATPYLNLVVNNTASGVDPIDVLHDQFSAWRALQIADPDLSQVIASPDALPIAHPGHSNLTVTPLNAMGGPLTAGAEVNLYHTGTGSLGAVVDQGDGTFTAQLGFSDVTGTDTIRATVVAGGQTVELSSLATVVNFLCGDVNEDGLHTSADIIYLVNYIFKGGPTPQPVALAGDTNRNNSVTSADIIYLVGYVFKSGLPPCS
jgi:uncharacterized Ntn-hydrolase superfamily protein